MRILVGDLPETPTPSPDPPGWGRIASPSSSRAHAAAWITGLAALAALLTVVIGASWLRPPPPGTALPDEATPWLAIAATLVLALPTHEFVHAVFYPGGALSAKITFFVWPRHLRLGVYYQGSVSREQWLVARLAPFVLLALIPAGLLAATAQHPRPLVVETVLSLLILVNSLGSGGDLMSAAWVYLNIPRGSTLGFFAGKAYREESSVSLDSRPND
jgi:hypothetical protein